ncbi:MAG: LamG-like jellyroll fold domain-containing protein [Pseudobdellovibrionaceae bacterium]
MTKKIDDRSVRDREQDWSFVKKFIGEKVRSGEITRRDLMKLGGLLASSGLLNLISFRTTYAGGLIPFAFIKRVATGTLGDAIDFDGANDYLSRASDFAGNVNSKTFTFSAWVWLNSTGSPLIVYSNLNTYFYIAVSTNFLYIEGKYTDGTSLLLATTSAGGIGIKTFNHILISVDLANTANRAVYINDVLQTTTWTNYNTLYPINFSRAGHGVGGTNTGSFNFPGRLAHVYLDYTYRDLSNSTNRRLFITADRKPTSNQAALNPILYLKLSAPATCNVNSGTGGDFVLNGVVAKSSRGPNQYNCAYSKFNGTSQWLSSTSFLGANSNQLTMSLWFNVDSLANGQYLYCSTSNGTQRIWLSTEYSGGLRCEMYGGMASGVILWYINTPFLVIGRNYHLVFSLDTSNSSNRQVYINGVAKTVTWSGTFDGGNVSCSDINAQAVGAWPGGGGKFTGKIGDIYLNKTYIDLSVAANLEKFVTGTGVSAMPVSLGASGELPTGSTPVIYLPMFANNSGANLGTIGDFTVNGGPLIGARGPSEFWGNCAVTTSTGGYLYKSSSLTGSIKTTSFFLSTYINQAVRAGEVFVIFVPSVRYCFRLSLIDNSGAAKVAINAYNDVGTEILYMTINTGASGGVPFHLMVSVDLSNTAKRSCAIDGVAVSATYTTYLNQSIDFTGSTSQLFRGNGSSASFDGGAAEFYLNMGKNYVDLSQESNRLLYRDAYGSLVDLQSQISTGAISSPTIYMRFDPANLGKNSGTGDDFMINGTITDGSQV